MIGGLKPRDLAIILLIMVIWGGNFPVAKIGLTELPASLLMGLRFLVAAALLCPFTRLPRGKLKPVMLLSTTMGIHFCLMFSGLTRMDASFASILTQLQVTFAAGLAAVVFKDRLGWQRAIGIAIAFAGVVLIIGQPKGTVDPLAVAMIMCASFAWAVANIQIKLIGPISGLALTGWMSLFAAPQLFLLSWALESGQIEALAHAGLRGYGAVFYNAVAVAIISYGMWYPMMRRYTVNQTMPFTLLVPLLGVLAGVVLLGERMSVQAVLGGIATVAGVAVIVLRRGPVPAIGKAEG